jgi:hypothetical protein
VSQFSKGHAIVLSMKAGKEFQHALNGADNLRRVRGFFQRMLLIYPLMFIQHAKL